MERTVPCLVAYEIQDQFPELKEFREDWRDVRQIMRGVEQTLGNEYKLIPLK